MVSSTRIAYTVLVAMVLIVPAWGCRGEVPPPPADVKKDAAEPKPPDVQLPDESEGDPADSPTDEGSDAK